MADLLESPRDAGRHPWEVARQRFFERVLADGGAFASARRVVDVGSGDAWFARSMRARLPSDAEVVCVDPGYSDEALAASYRDGRLRLARERPRASFDLVLLLDVLEHVEDDLAFLSELASDLAAGARVLISVPAWPALFTRHDSALRHFRRYSPSRAAELIAKSGLTVERSGGLFHSLLLPRAASRLAETFANGEVGPPPPLTWAHGRGFTAAVGAALAADNAVSAWSSRVGLALPGLSWWALCRR